MLTIILGLTDKITKNSVLSKIDDYWKRYNEIKKTLEKINEKSEFVGTIEIKENSTGHSYNTIFGSYLQETVIEIEIKDAYIRVFHQVTIISKVPF